MHDADDAQNKNNGEGVFLGPLQFALIEDCDLCMHMSCQCFAEMLIHFCFGKFLSLRIGSIFLTNVMSKFCVKLTDLIILLISCMEIMIELSKRVVTRYLKSVRKNMIQNKGTKIRCLCR
jgi:hypothetical protein